MKPSSESGRDDLREISQGWIDEELMGARRVVVGEVRTELYEMAKYEHSTIMPLGKQRVVTH